MPIGLFVDGGYTRCSCRGVEMTCLARYLEQALGDRIAVAMFFDGRSDAMAPGTANFHRLIAKPRSRGGAGFRLELFPVDAHPVLYPDGSPVLCADGLPLLERKQVGVDIAMALAMLRTRAAGQWDKLALMAGDGDFAPTLAELIGGGAKAWLVCGGRTLSKHLLALRAEVIDVLAEPARLYLVKCRGRNINC